MACSGCILFCPNNSDHQTKHRFNIFQPYYPTKSYKFGNLGFHFPQNLSNINIESKHIQTHISSFVEEEWCNQVITIHSFFFFFVACSGCILFCPNNSDHQTKHRFNIFQPYYPTKSYKLGNLGFYFPQNLSNIESKHIQTQLLNMYFKLCRSRMV